MKFDFSKIIIIGGSHSGIFCAEKLRQFGFKGSITIFEKLEGYPFQRPPLSKTFLFSKQEDEKKFLLRKSDWFKNLKIDLKSGIEVISINKEAKSLVLSDNSKMNYDKLVIATGAYPKNLNMFDAELKNVFVLRTYYDAFKIKASLRKKKNILIVGGGYIGLELAASLRQLNKNITVLEQEKRLLARVATKELSKFCFDIHFNQGINFKLSSQIENFEHNNNLVKSVVFSDKSKDNCDLIIIGIGVVPDVKLFKNLDLNINNGIIVSENFKTLDNNIWAIGDIANVVSKNDFRIESIHNAQLSASKAASDILNRPIHNEEAPWFWSDQFDIKFQMVGILPKTQDKYKTIFRKGKGDNSVSFWTFLKGKLVLVEVANDPLSYMIGKKCIENDFSPNPLDINNINFDLKSLIKNF